MLLACSGREARHLDCSRCTCGPTTHLEMFVRLLIRMCNLDLNGETNFTNTTGWTSLYVSQSWKKKYPVSHWVADKLMMSLAAGCGRKNYELPKSFTSWVLQLVYQLKEKKSANTGSTWPLKDQGTVDLRSSCPRLRHGSNCSVSLTVVSSVIPLWDLSLLNLSGLDLNLPFIARQH